MGIFEDIFRKKPKAIVPPEVTIPERPETEKSIEPPKVEERRIGISIETETESKRYKSTPEEEVLERKDKSSSKPLGGGINETIFVSLKDDGDGIFKPKQGRGDLEYLNERAAYLVDRFLDFGMVPPTVIRELDKRTGSVQRFVPDAKTGRELTREEMDQLTDGDKLKLNILDILIANTDRHEGNFLVKGGRIIAIDHGYSFGCTVYGRGLYFEFKNPPEITLEIKEKIKKLSFEEERRSILKDLLLEILPLKNVEAFFRRLQILTQTLEELDWVYDFGTIRAEMSH